MSTTSVAKHHHGELIATNRIVVCVAATREPSHNGVASALLWVIDVVGGVPAERPVETQAALTGSGTKAARFPFG